jgi:hypothetical protein
MALCKRHHFFTFNTPRIQSGTLEKERSCLVALLRPKLKTTNLSFSFPGKKQHFMTRISTEGSSFFCGSRFCWSRPAWPSSSRLGWWEDFKDSATLAAAGEAGDKLLSCEACFGSGLKIHVVGVGGNGASEMALLRLCGDACVLIALPRGTKLKALDPGCGA